MKKANYLMFLGILIFFSGCQKEELIKSSSEEIENQPLASTFKTASSGEFSVLTYNVAGLPQILSSATNRDVYTPIIGEKTNAFDLVNVQEDFNYHAALYSTSLHPYRTATSGGVPFGDGLNTMSNFSFSDFDRIKWNDCNGTDCLTPKGFTFMRIRIDEGVYIDFYNAHTNAQDTEADLAARRANITQLSQYIANNSQGNAVIVMGDMNCRYTRSGDNIRELITNNGMTDVWIEVERNGDYPPQGGTALACSWPYFNDVTCEVVDKIFYRSSQYIDLDPTSYQLDDPDWVSPDGTEPLSDHYPLMADFNYSISADFLMSDLFGGPHGNPFNDLDDISANSLPVKFTIRAGSRIDNVGVTLSDGSILSHGGSGGTARNLTLNSGEYVNYVKMCSGQKDGHTRIFYIKLKTNQGRELSCGSQTSDTKEFYIPSGWKLTGFFGNSGDEVDKLGLIYTQI